MGSSFSGTTGVKKNPLARQHQLSLSRFVVCVCACDVLACGAVWPRAYSGQACRIAAAYAHHFMQTGLGAPVPPNGHLYLLAQQTCATVLHRKHMVVLYDKYGQYTAAAQV